MSLDHEAALATADEPRRGVRDRAQYGMCAALALLGAVICWDAGRLGAVTSSNDPVGPRPVALVIGVALVVIAAFYALDVRRGGVGEAEGGEDVDLEHKTDWRTVVTLGAVFLLNALVIDWLGWVISGSLLFTGTAYALGNRHHLRGLAIGVALALITFYGFAVGLGVNLPAGVLQGIL